MSDLQLRQDVLNELRFDPRLDATYIGVIAEGGVVTLTGHVSNYVEKLAAERATRRIKGVRAIAEEIEVRVPDHKKSADDEIARRAADILILNSTIPQDAIQITVHEGLVELGGEVEWEFQRAAAQSQVSKLSGIAGVVNNIILKKHPHDSEVRQQIEEAFRRSWLMNGSSIQVSILEGGKVILDGDVKGLAQCRAAEAIAWSVPGATSVENRLTVV